MSRQAFPPVPAATVQTGPVQTVRIVRDPPRVVIAQYAAFGTMSFAMGVLATALVVVAR